MLPKQTDWLINNNLSEFLANSRFYTEFLSISMQGRVNQKETDLNLCNFWWPLFNFQIIFNSVKLERAVISVKHNASVFSLIFLPKSLIWSTMVLPAPNSSILLELVRNEPKKAFSIKFQQHCFLFLIDLCLI